MESKVSTRLSRQARKGDILYLGTALSPGSPAKDKDPFTCFYFFHEPDQKASFAHGDMFRFIAPEHPRYDRRLVIMNTQVYNPQTMRKILPTYAVFLDTFAAVLFDALPKDHEFRCELIEESKYFPRY